MSDAPDDLVATPSQTVGPFFHVGLGPWRAAGPGSSEGRRLALRIRVVDGDGVAVHDALIEAWTAGGLVRQPTGEDGCCELEIDKAAYVNICLFARGLLRQLQTRAYFAGDASLHDDGVLKLVPEARRHTLLARADDRQPDRWLFDIRLQGDDETVFFDA